MLIKCILSRCTGFTSSVIYYYSRLLLILINASVYHLNIYLLHL